MPLDPLSIIEKTCRLNAGRFSRKLRELSALSAAFQQLADDCRSFGDIDSADDAWYTAVKLSNLYNELEHRQQ